MADETVTDGELESVRHWAAFDLAVACAVGYTQARAALDTCERDVERARRQLLADTAALDEALATFNTERRYHPLIVDLALARGQHYYDLLRQILADIGPAMVADCDRFRAETGTVTPVNLGQLMLRYGLSFKATCEWLEEAHCLPAGTHDRLKESRLRVRDVLEAARKAEAQCAL